MVAEAGAPSWQSRQNPVIDEGVSCVSEGTLARDAPHADAPPSPTTCTLWQLAQASALPLSATVTGCAEAFENCAWTSRSFHENGAEYAAATRSSADAALWHAKHSSAPANVPLVVAAVS
jgi:hypothetical protein